MAITTICSLVDDDGEGGVLKVGGNTISTTSGNFARTHQWVIVGLTEAALAKGGVSTIGWAWFKNYNDTNYILIRAGSGGTDFARVQPNSEFAMFIGVSMSPWAIASVTTCNLEYAFFAL